MMKANTKLRFGRHKGQRLCEVPTGYLEWLYSIAEEPLLSAVEDELDRRLRVEDEALRQMLEAGCGAVVVDSGNGHGVTLH